MLTDALGSAAQHQWQEKHSEMILIVTISCHFSLRSHKSYTLGSSSCFHFLASAAIYVCSGDQCRGHSNSQSFVRSDSPECALIPHNQAVEHPWGTSRTGTASQSATQCFCTNYDLRLAPVVLQPLTPDKPSLDMKAHDSFCSSCERVSPQ